MSADFTTVYPADGSEPWEAECDHCGLHIDLDHYSDIEAHDTMERQIEAGTLLQYYGVVYRYVRVPSDTRYQGGDLIEPDSLARPWSWYTEDRRYRWSKPNAEGDCATWAEALDAALAAVARLNPTRTRGRR